MDAGVVPATSFPYCLAGKQGNGVNMSFKLRWTEPTGAQSEAVPTAKAAMDRYVELLEKGYVRVEVHDDSGKKLTPNDLAELVAFDTKAKLNTTQT
jgi:hypothetical protein